MVIDKSYIVRVVGDYMSWWINNLLLPPTHNWMHNCIQYFLQGWIPVVLTGKMSPVCQLDVTWCIPHV